MQWVALNIGHPNFRKEYNRQLLSHPGHETLQIVTPHLLHSTWALFMQLCRMSGILMLVQLLSCHNPIHSIPTFLLLVDMDMVMVMDMATNMLPAQLSKLVHRGDTYTVTPKGDSTKGQLMEVVHIIHRVLAGIIMVDRTHSLQWQCCG